MHWGRGVRMREKDTDSVMAKTEIGAVLVAVVGGNPSTAVSWWFWAVWQWCM